MKDTAYCPDAFNYQRRSSRPVKVGNIGIGGDHPIRVQSMTTTNTLDVDATVAQSIRMIEVGCELVRITAPSRRDAEALELIAQQLREAGHDVPLVADIHFTPNAAEIAAEHVEKIRVNPGNYADKKRFENLVYTDESYEEELSRIRVKFTPLVRKCKTLGKAMRIGTNHGSLSDRIMSRYGDTALGLVESALEFLRICVDEGYFQVVVSMKSSNPQVMVQAYRLLVARMEEENMAFPLHLGVTEAGDGEEDAPPALAEDSGDEDGQAPMQDLPADRDNRGATHASVQTVFDDGGRLPDPAMSLPLPPLPQLQSPLPQKVVVGCPPQLQSAPTRCRPQMQLKPPPTPRPLAQLKQAQARLTDVSVPMYTFL